LIVNTWNPNDVAESEENITSPPLTVTGDCSINKFKLTSKEILFIFRNRDNN